jgi:hypothetical protein
MEPRAGLLTAGIESRATALCLKSAPCVLVCCLTVLRACMVPATQLSAHHWPGMPSEARARIAPQMSDPSPWGLGVT